MDYVKCPERTNRHQSTVPRRQTEAPRSMRAAEVPDIPPPSYDAVQLQQHCERLLQTPDTPLQGVTEHLRDLAALGIYSDVYTSEKNVLQHLKAFSDFDPICTAEDARKHPWALLERVQQFLLSCVARDSGVDLITLSEGEKQYFILLHTAYERSWLHQMIHGWERTSPETHRLAYETFYFFIERPLRHWKIPLAAFTWHARVLRSVHRFRLQGPSLSERPPASPDPRSRPCAPTANSTGWKSSCA